MTYKGFDVFPKDILFLNSINKTIRHDMVILGQPYQNQLFEYNKSDRFQFNVTLKFDDYDEYTKIRRWFRYLKGKGTKFWFPSIANEITLLAPVNAGDTVLLVENPLYDYFSKRKRMFLYFPDFDFVTKVKDLVPAGFTGVSDNIRVAKLTLTDPLPQSITDLSNCPYVTELFLGTMTTDSITFQFIDLVRGQVSFGFEEITQAHYEILNL